MQKKCLYKSNLDRRTFAQVRTQMFNTDKSCVKYLVVLVVLIVLE